MKRKHSETNFYQVVLFRWSDYDTIHYRLGYCIDQQIWHRLTVAAPVAVVRRAVHRMANVQPGALCLQLCRTGAETRLRQSQNGRLSVRITATSTNWNGGGSRWLFDEKVNGEYNIESIINSNRFRKKFQFAFNYAP